MKKDRRRDQLRKEFGYKGGLKEILQNSRADIHVLGGTVREAHIVWDLNPMAKRDQIFELHVGDQMVRVAKQEILALVRAV